jgi:transglutaminase-like putative cysteine protease
MRLSAAYSGRTVEVVLGTGESTSRKVLKVPSGGVLSADSSFLSLGQDVTVGSRAVVYYLNPLTVALDRAVVTIEAKERVALDGEEFDAVRISASTPLGRIRTWESPPGEVLWVEMPLGMAMYRMDEKAARALDTPEPTRLSAGARAREALKPPSDFAVATSVVADRAIPEPRRVRRLTAEVAGIPDGGYVLVDARQRVATVPGRDGVRAYTIRAASTPAADCPLPVTRPELKRYMAASPYLDMDRAEVKQLARSLRDVRSATRTASRIRAWIRRNLTPDYSIGVPRSATDVLRTKSGVCRDYATLFGAVARAAGVPTRLVGGIVYADGRFFYHAWVECWTGAWTPYDATLDADFVDATHVKFSQGDPTDMMRVFAVVGKLSVKVLDIGV